MKVQELIDLLANCNPDANAKVVYAYETWEYCEEHGSEEVLCAAWGNVNGVFVTKTGDVKIYCSDDDVTELSDY